MPALSFTSPQSSLAPPLSPPCMPLTPRRVLHMEEEEEEELSSPQMKDFGLVEHTLCLNNDFTMDLHRMATRWDWVRVSWGRYDCFSSALANDRYADTDFLKPVFGADAAFAPSIDIIKITQL